MDLATDTVSVPVRLIALREEAGWGRAPNRFSVYKACEGRRGYVNGPMPARHSGGSRKQERGVSAKREELIPRKAWLRPLQVRSKTRENPILSQGKSILDCVELLRTVN